jgi:CheY-like chemotaxis protein
MRVAREAGVKQLALTHHDPMRTDDQLDEIVVNARATMAAYNSPIHVFAAAEGQAINVAGESSPGNAALPLDTAKHTIDTADRVNTVLIGVYDPKIRALLTKALAGDTNIRVVEAADSDGIRASASTARPSVAFLQHGPGHDALAICRAIATDRAGDRRQMPVVMIADREVAGGKEAGVAEWMLKPFSGAYAHAKVQAWVLRGMSRWRKAAVPDDEARRLASLKASGLLDTPPDPRFDRITRLASRYFAVPIALISLVDRDRQWFKASVGLDIVETSREASFCAYTVVDRKTLVVNDALADDRFAENPLVIGEPRVRFYAGAPLILSNGTCLGSLCLMDTRPRWFAADDTRLLEDLRDLAVSELEREPVPIEARA